jgi:hypothetical protein
MTRSTSITTLLISGLRSVRTLGLATAVAGVAVVGLTSGAPSPAAASAGGPDAFVHLEHGTVPIFFCDPAKPHKHHNTDKHPYKCTDVAAPTRF